LLLLPETCNTIYLKSFLGGLAGLIVVAVISAVILMIDSLSSSSQNNNVSFDWLAIVQNDWFASLLIAAIAFALGFLWQYLKSSKRVSR
jgi:chromate transport protein ChrA